MPSWTSFSVRVSMEEVRLVQNQHRRVRHCGTGNGQQLPLSLGEVGAVSGQHGVVAVRQPADKAIGIGKLCCGDALLIGGIQSSVADILHHSPGEQMGVLQNNPQRPAQIGLSDLVDIDAVIADLAVCNVVKAVDEVGDGGLAGTGGAYKGNLLARAWHTV